MTIDRILLTISLVLTIVMLILFVPKNKFKEAQVIFFIKLLMTWFLGLSIVELRFIEYPVRLFSYATRASFSFEYFIYPSICVIFSLHYPEKKGLLRICLHYFNFCTVMTIIEVLLERYTNLIKYIHWNWLLTWLTLFITFYLSRKYYVWFFNLKAKPDMSK